mmetsp:Transcript_102554/g.285759  ORF Transcript_102554/g.285759 Transcript_102554/m.285759 type:complete len:84 (-) Transcript_102554:13-264(-)
MWHWSDRSIVHSVTPRHTSCAIAPPDIEFVQRLKVGMRVALANRAVLVGECRTGFGAVAQTQEAHRPVSAGLGTVRRCVSWPA